MRNLLPFIILLLLFRPNNVTGVSVAPIKPHELAYLEAPIVAIAQVLSFGSEKGVEVGITRVIRGTLATGSRLRLKGTNQYPYLNAPGTRLTLFLQSIDQEEAVLWSGPTTGGILWDDTETVALIAQARTNPRASLGSQNPRERFAAAYFIAMGNRSSRTESYDIGVAKVLEILAWGLGRKENEINQAALDAIRVLHIDLKAIVGEYKPWYRLDIKQERANQFLDWLKKRF